MFEEMRGDPEAASILSLLHELVGGPLAEIQLGDVREVLELSGTRSVGARPAK